MFHEIYFRINIDIDSESVLGLIIKLNVFIIVGGSRNKQLKARLYTF